MSQKKLHVHTVPIVMVAVAVFMSGATLAFASGVLGSYVSASVSGQALTAQVLKISPNRDGLASIKPNTDVKTPAPQVQSQFLLSGSEELANGTLTEMQANQVRASLPPSR
jgi:hypothetical protein